MGIVSTNPAFVGNAFWGLDGIRPPGYHLIGLVGQVPTRVTNEGGAIRPGDSLTAGSTPGTARKAATGREYGRCRTGAADRQERHHQRADRTAQPIPHGGSHRSKRAGNYHGCRCTTEWK
jgi:hypothetical protein